MKEKMPTAPTASVFMSSIPLSFPLIYGNGESEEIQKLFFFSFFFFPK
jgi:hypothetical protein